MLRGVTNSSVPVTGTRFIDILKPQSLCVVKDASGDITPADDVFARDQGSAGIGGSFSAPEVVDAGSVARQHAHGSLRRILRVRHEQVRQSDSPRSPDRGPIEARA